ncbi:MAG: translation initiation factor IF-2 [Rickettsiaceae bacterium]
MTNNEGEDKPKKLTLNNTKLSFGKKNTNKTVVRTFVNSTSKVVVEVKQNNNQNLKAINEKTIASKDFDKNLSLIKSALQEESKSKSEVKIDSISQIASMNKSEDDNVIDSSNLNNQKETDKNVTIADPNKEEKVSTDHLKSKPEENNLNEISSVAKTHQDDQPSGNYAKYDKDKTQTGKIDAQDNKIQHKVHPKEQRKLKKSDMLNMLNNDESNDVGYKTRSLASIKRAQEKKRRMQNANKSVPEKVCKIITIPEMITVGELASLMSERVADVIRELLKLNVLVNANQSIDADTAELVVGTFGHTVKRIKESDIENILIEDKETTQQDIKSIAPIVTIMGHVDHGKTSLLDALKSTDLAASESGGITQHIGAYKVLLKDGQSITFIDTPGHEAFSDMRMHGAQVTNIVVLVVAADDGVKPQTIEAINHSKAAKVPIIVAVNKIDRPNANVERVKHELLAHDIVSEDLGGDAIFVPVSALNKTNLDKLEEAILLVAEMQDLKANYAGKASGVVIESRLDIQRGICATVLIQSGTLKIGDLIIAGEAYGRVKVINNDKSQKIDQAFPSDPVEIYGLNDLPHSGYKMHVVDNEKQASDITEYRSKTRQDKQNALSKKSTLESLFASTNIEQEKILNLIVKCDVHGSVEAIKSSLAKLFNNEIKFKIVHGAVGGITKSDILLAANTNSIIVGFNIKHSNSQLASLAESESIEIRYYSIIYQLIDDIKNIMQGMLSPIITEKLLGSAEVKEVFHIDKVGKVAGLYVTQGIIKSDAKFKLSRNDAIIHEGNIKTLRYFKDKVSEVRAGFECGITFENYSDIKVADQVEAFAVTSEQKIL